MYQTFVSVLRHRAATSPDRVAFALLSADDDEAPQTITYGVLYERALAVAALFARERHGNRVLLVIPAGIEFICALFGCWLAGQIAVPAYVPGSRRRVGRLEAIQNDAECSSVLTSEAAFARLVQAFAEAPALAGALVRCVPSDPPALGSADIFEPQDSNIALLQYTSGTTGSSKGVVVSHANLVANSNALSMAFRYTPETRCFSWLPPFHDMGLVGCILQPVYGGFPCTLMPPASFLQKPLRWLQGISDHRATLSGAPDFAYDLCARKMEASPDESIDLACWTVAFSGAEPVRATTLDRFARAFRSCGFKRDAFLPCYGLAESTLFVSGYRAGTLLPIKSVNNRAPGGDEVVDADYTEPGVEVVGCGMSVPEQRLLIVNPKARLPITDGVGEIWLHSPSCAQGYWRQPDMSREVFRARLANGDGDEYLRTGDLGFIQDGQLFIAGRIKELLIIRGRNHYPQSIEDTVASCLELNSNSVLAFSIFEEGEERLMVAIEPERRQELYPPETFELVRERVSTWHEISVWRFVITRPHGIPRTTSGKKQRRAFQIDYLRGRTAVLEWPPTANGRSSYTTDDEGPPTAARDPIELVRLILARRARLSVESVAPDQPLSWYGLDSLVAAETAAEAEEALGRHVSAADFISDRTIRDVVLNATPIADRAMPVLDSTKGAGLSFQQQAILTASELSDVGSGLAIAQAYRIEGELDLPRIQASLQLVVDRHEALRTRCSREGQSIIQHLTPVAEVIVRETMASSTEEADRYLAQTAWAPFDRNVDGPIRAELVRVSSTESYLLIALDHLFADLISMAVVLEDFKHAYQTSSLQERPGGGFFEYLATVAQSPMAAENREAREFWSQLLRLPIEQITLPFERQTTGAQAVLRPARFVRRQLDSEVVRQVRAACSASGVTLFTGLVAAFAGMLQRCGNTKPIALAAPMNARPGKRFLRTVGPFVNLVPVVLDLTADLSWRDLIAHTKDAVLNAIRRQSFPLAEVVELARGIHGTRVPLPSDVMVTIYGEQNPGYDVFSSLIGDSQPASELPGYWTHAIQKHLTQFRLAVHFADRSNGIDAVFEYDEGRFTEREVQDIAALFEQAVHSMAAMPTDGPASRSIGLPAEHRERIFAANSTARAYDGPALLHTLVRQQLVRTPDREAIVFGSEGLSYRELYRRVDLLAETLVAAGVKGGSVVAVFMERSIELTVSLLGILEAGGAYLPLGIEYPAERLNTILTDAAPPVILTQPKLAGRLPNRCGEVICLGRDWGADAPSVTRTAAPIPSPDDLAYVIYTSGSTGSPKGAMNTHRGICNRLLWMQERYSLNDTDRVLQKTPYTFDVSVWEFFWPLLVGAALVVASPDAHKDSRELSHLIIEQRVTTVHFVPSLLQAFLDEPASAECTSLRRIICSGEALWPKLHRLCVERLGAEVHNLYGPTEAAVDATAWDCAAEATLPVVPIGTPIANMQAHVLDRYGDACPLGVVGMLHLSGVGLARGYWRRPALTAERFMPHPSPAEAGQRLYDTGDLARWRSEGYLEFLGRTDGQVKIHGCRIEAAEIEAALLRSPEVSQCVVIIGKVNDHELVLTALVTGTSPNVSTAGLKAFLRSNIPEWMIPAHIVVLESLPLNSNGKVDRKAAAAAMLTSRLSTTVQTTSQTPAEIFVSRVWCGILQCNEVPAGANFFDLGGHSLAALRLRARLEEELGVAVPLRALLDAPTVEETVTRIALHLAGEDPSGCADGILAGIESMPDAELPPAVDASRAFFERNHTELSLGDMQ